MIFLTQETETNYRNIGVTSKQCKAAAADENILALVIQISCCITSQTIMDWFKAQGLACHWQVLKNKCLIQLALVTRIKDCRLVSVKRNADL